MSTPRTWFSRARLSSTCVPLESGTEAPTRLVLPPCGTKATPASRQASTTAATSAVLPGRTTQRALPR